jgi:pilus assembly protein CpaE
MKQSVRVIVFNGDEEYSASIRADLLSIPGVQIVAELDELALVEQAVSQFSAEILLMHLDPAPEAVLPVAARMAASRGLTVLVISSSADAQHILFAMRAGVREFLTKPVDRALLTSAVEKILVQSEASAEVGSLVSVIGTIGGCGASSLAVNLAVELNDLLKKPAQGARGTVAVVDLDFRYGQLGTMLDLQADYTIADLSDTPEQLDSAMFEKAMVKHPTGVHLLARPNQFAQADHITAAHCASVLSALQRLYSYVIVDGPNRFDSGGSAVLELADVNLLVIQLLVTSVRNVHRMLEGLREGGFNLSRFRLVCNRVGRESSHLCISHVEKTLNMKVWHEAPDDWKAMSTAINMGVPLIESAPKSKLRQAIREMAESLLNREPALAEAAATSGKGGLFGRIFSSTS